MLRVPGDVPPEDGAAGAHGVTHWGNALQGRPAVPRVTRGIGMWTLLPRVVPGTSPLKPAFLAHPVTLL